MALPSGKWTGCSSRLRLTSVLPARLATQGLGRCRFQAHAGEARVVAHLPEIERGNGVDAHGEDVVGFGLEELHHVGMHACHVA